MRDAVDTQAPWMLLGNMLLGSSIIWYIILISTVKPDVITEGLVVSASDGEEV